MLELDKLQKEAVGCSFKNALVVAAPGSGKTTVIVNRLVYLIHNLNIDPGNIAVITFTRAAAKNMSERFQKLNKTAGMPFFGTLHSLFLSIILEYTPDFSIIPEADTENIIKQVLLKYLDEISIETIKEAINNISIFKISCTTITDFKPSIDKRVFYECYEEYESYMRKNKLFDFDDIMLCCKNLLVSRPDILRKYRWKYKFLLIDEFQDCDNLQMEIVSLLSKGNSVFAVGDEDQSIYGFRGSKPEYMVKFNNIFPGGKLLFLSTNYRCPEAVVNISINLIKNNILRNKKMIVPNSKFKGEIQLAECVDEYEEAVKVVSRIEKNISHGTTSYKDNVVLYRTHKEASFLIQHMLSLDIPFNLLNKYYSFFENSICLDLTAYLKLSQDTTDRESFIRIINKPLRYIGKLILLNLKKHKYREDCCNIILSGVNLNLLQMKEIYILKRRLIKLKNMNPADAIDYILQKTGYAYYMKKSFISQNLSCEDFDNVVTKFKALSKTYAAIQDFLSFIDEEKDCGDVEQSIQGVILSTIHGVKGMEFKNVYIINCCEGNIPYTIKGNTDIEEERRLFYVAVTRTIENLYLYYPKKFNGCCSEASTFIKECNMI